MIHPLRHLWSGGVNWYLMTWWSTQKRRWWSDTFWRHVTRWKLWLTSQKPSKSGWMTSAVAGQHYNVGWMTSAVARPGIDPSSEEFIFPPPPPPQLTFPCRAKGCWLPVAEVTLLSRVLSRRKVTKQDLAFTPNDRLSDIFETWSDFLCAVAVSWCLGANRLQ